MGTINIRSERRIGGGNTLPQIPKTVPLVKALDAYLDAPQGTRIFVESSKRNYVLTGDKWVREQ